MPSQHTTEEQPNQETGIVVPLELEGLRILRQEVQADGKLRVEVMATRQREACRHCGSMCVKQHEVRPRRKRDIPLRGHQVELVLYKRRFWCINCHKAFTESDNACGWRKRTTVRLREEIGQPASSRPIAHVASHYQVGPTLRANLSGGRGSCPVSQAWIESGGERQVTDAALSGD